MSLLHLQLHFDDLTHLLAPYDTIGVLLMMSDKDDCARKCFSALQQIESNPVIWASLGCVFERKEPESGSDGGTEHKCQWF